MKPNSPSTEIKKLLEEIRLLMDDSNGPSAPIVRRAVRLAGLVGDAEHRDLFQLHLEGLLYAKSEGPRHAPWKDPEWKPRWDVRKAFSDDRQSTGGNIALFPLEELEQHYRRLRDERLRFRNSGNVQNELKLFDLEVDAENTIFRIRRRVDTFLQLVINWLDLQESSEAESHQFRPMGGAVFIGHGRSLAWHDLKDFLSERLGLSCVEFNSESAAGKTTVERLAEMLDTSYFAFLVMTAEDEHADSSLHARENVIHEVGLFQGRLGFTRAIVLIEEGCEEFSNISGLTHISYPKGSIGAKYEEVRRVLEREGLISPGHFK